MAPSARRSRVAAVLESRVFYSHRSRMHSIHLEPEPEPDSMKDSYRCQMGRIRKIANPGLTRISGRRKFKKKRDMGETSRKPGHFKKMDFSKNGTFEKLWEKTNFGTGGTFEKIDPHIRRRTKAHRGLLRKFGPLGAWAHVAQCPQL